jgi:TRAP-type C4-dicarboxylate transport system substrate-binding protein
VISGYASSREVLKDFGLADQVGHVTDYAFGVSNTFVAVMDQAAFDALPEDVQTAMDDLREEMSTFASEYHDNENVGGALEWASQEKGLKTVPLEEGQEEAWDKAQEPLVNQWLQDAEGNGFEPQEVLDRTEELAEQYNAESCAE